MTTEIAEPGMSTNEYTAKLARRRMAHEAKGQVLLMPGIGLVVVPFQQHACGWDAIVVGGDETYTPRGWPVSFSNAEIETALQVFTEQDIVEAGQAKRQSEGVPTHDEMIGQSRG